MTNNLINVRLLQHDTEDQIRIGQSFPTWDTSIDNVSDHIKKQLEKETAWCGGLDKACERFYKKIAIVDAITFRDIKIIYSDETK
jgi:hypothetical protein